MEGAKKKVKTVKIWKRQSWSSWHTHYKAVPKSRNGKDQTRSPLQTPIKSDGNTQYTS